MDRIEELKKYLEAWLETEVKDFEIIDEDEYQEFKERMLAPTSFMELERAWEEYEEFFIVCIADYFEETNIPSK